MRALRHYEKIRSCQEQLQMLVECRDLLSAMITFQKKLNEMEKIYIDYIPTTIFIRGRYMESGRSGEMADYNSGAGNKVV